MNNQTIKIKNEEKLLAIFYDTNSERDIFRAPFVNTKYNEVFSTDGHCVIRIPISMVCGKYKEFSLNIRETICRCNKIITLKALKAALSKCPQIDEEMVTQKSIECKECNGLGWVEWVYTDKCGREHLEAFDCPICHGTGYEVSEKRKKTGRKIAESIAIVKIGDTFFYAKELEKIISAMELLEVNKVELTSNPFEGKHQVSIGDICIDFMPMCYIDNIDRCYAEVELSEK